MPVAYAVVTPVQRAGKGVRPNGEWPHTQCTVPVDCRKSPGFPAALTDFTTRRARFAGIGTSTHNAAALPCVVPVVPTIRRCAGPCIGDTGKEKRISAHLYPINPRRNHHSALADAINSAKAACCASAFGTSRAPWRSHVQDFRISPGPRSKTPAGQGSHRVVRSNSQVPSTRLSDLGESTLCASASKDGGKHALATQLNSSARNNGYS